MNWFLAKIQDNTIVLNEAESLHLAKVLRKQLGDLIHFFDGNGVRGTAQLTRVHPKKSEATIVEKTQDEPLKATLTLAIAPTKSMDRLGFVLEKGTELGVSRFIPLFTQHSERNKLNIERCEKIVLAAAKQSQKSYLPEVSAAVKFNEFLNTQKAYDSAYIAHCEKAYARTPLKATIFGTNNVVLIGPEGDFSQNEIENAQNKGFKGLLLSNHRLRTETAALQVASCWDLFNL